MDKAAELEKIKSKTGIDDLASATGKDFEKIQELAAKGDITKEQMKLLVEAMPHFVQLQQAYVDGLKAVINSAKETQKDALRGISVTLENITDLLKTIIHKSETEELRSKIADIALKLADYGLEIAKIIQETNKENNNTWKYIASGVSAVVLLVGGLWLRKK
jgi:polyhydroxyalkanoate synthesis regulator phasin